MRLEFAAAGLDIEQIARELHKRRRAIGLRCKLRTPLTGRQGQAAISPQPAEVWNLLGPSDDGYAVSITTPERSYEFGVDTSASEADTTAFASIEDSSFGLWAARIIEAEDRQKVLLEVLVDAPLDAVPEHAHDGPVVLQDPWVKPASSADRRTEKRSAQ